MNILMLGNNGFVGSVVQEKIKQNNNVYVVNENFDVTEKNETFNMLNRYVKEKNITCIINCIAMANLDDCEKEKELCKKINLEFVKCLCDFSVNKKIYLIHISSNAVYDGNNAPYSETDIKNPVNYYGKCKAEADDYINNKASNFAIVRPITIYGSKNKNDRHNPVTYFVEKLINNESIKLVDDNIVNMVHVKDFADAVSFIIDNKLTGEFNISGDVSESRYDLGVRICNVLDIDLSLIEKVSGKDFIMLAERPNNTSFNNSKMKIELKIKPRSLDRTIMDVGCEYRNK
ncbi:sugar nucleotide-binding protein [Photobacterium phosphoreum]|uniref:Sugar nucleotide-binding protein n=1 Tax=Photobacterium phosphoreum TaxID=659 RepID=A0AAW4ZKD4_PHOPO|nr:sugar nucleotide-binding protein [Photobacterium phosphoreum]MCD9490700.1 sugar nucleotide-binding protein [Photobacterium phosphoreum]MCF2189966.1 sugar nucleotide-binding protein [Photobacterium phosphoreum]MCF2300825.1 sugar nucleotide-binding protein [Photobacterium phosphoreum]